MGHYHDLMAKAAKLAQARIAQNEKTASDLARLHKGLEHHTWNLLECGSEFDEDRQLRVTFEKPTPTSRTAFRSTVTLNCKIPHHQPFPLRVPFEYRAQNGGMSAVLGDKSFAVDDQNGRKDFADALALAFDHELEKFYAND